jgi:hypothetical protein
VSPSGLHESLLLGVCRYRVAVSAFGCYLPVRVPVLLAHQVSRANRIGDAGVRRILAQYDREEAAQREADCRVLIPQPRPGRIDACVQAKLAEEKAQAESEVDPYEGEGPPDEL